MPNWFGPPVLILAGAVLAAFGALWASQQQTQFERELRQKSEEITNLSRKTLGAVTGGDSFPWSLPMIDQSANPANLLITTEGEHPLFDLQVRIVDVEKIAELGANNMMSRLDEAETILKIGTLGGQRGVSPIRIELGDGNRRGFNLFFLARNGSFIHFLRFARVDGRWLTASKVTGTTDDQILLERIPEGFPKLASGEVDW